MKIEASPSTRTAALASGSDLTLDWPEGLDARQGQIAHPSHRPGRTGAASGEADDPMTVDSTGGGLPLSALLRGLGALVIVGAFVLYLFEGWKEGDDFTRSLLLLGHTVALTAAGFGLGHWLHESKGARLFIALALAAMPVSFAFLGGITYDHLGAVMAPAGGFWQSAVGGTLSLGAALSLTLSSTAVLALCAAIGFLVLARRSAWRLTALYLLANLALLVPVRDGLAVSGLLLALVLLLSWAILWLSRVDRSLATTEGRVARLLLVLPLAVIAGRSAWLYAPGALFFGVLALAGYVAVRTALVAGARRSGGWSGAWESAGVAFAISAAACLFDVLVPLDGLADALQLPVTALLLAGLLVDLGNRSAGRLVSYRCVAVWVLTSAMAINLLVHGGLGPALVAACAGGVALASGYLRRDRGLFVLGMLVALLGVGYGAEAALSHFTVGGWTALVLLGGTIIVAGSVLERHGARVGALVASGRAHFRQQPEEHGSVL